MSLLLIKKGIFNPVYSLMQSYIIVPVIWIFRIIVYYSWLINWDWEVDSYLLACTYVDIAICIVSYVLALKIFPLIKHRRIRKTSVSTNYKKLAAWNLGLGIIHITWICLFFNIFVQFDVTADGTDAFLYYYILSLGCVMMLFFYIYSTMAIGRLERLKGEVNRTLSSLQTQRSPIIFLRSFELDKYTVVNKTFDEYICCNFSQTSQPILSLSDPDSFLPTGGSIKIQSFDEKWKDAIITLFKSCRAVVIFEGRSDGLHWEIENLRNYINADQLFIATPPLRYRMRAWMQCQELSMLFHMMFSRKEMRRVFGFIWQNFAKHMRKEGISIALTEPGSNHIISLNDSWIETDCERLKGKKLFDYILDKTVCYEMNQCDYSEISKQLKNYELQQTLTGKEIKRIKKSNIIIILIIIVLYVFCGFV